MTFRFDDDVVAAVLRHMNGDHVGDNLLIARGFSPEPDLVVVPRDIDRVTEPPLWAVEVLSPSDRRRLQRGPTRIEGKHLDYATYGIADYLEVDLAAGRPVVIRYERHNGVLVEVDRAEGDKRLVADRPFAYEVVPARLLD